MKYYIEFICADSSRRFACDKNLSFDRGMFTHQFCRAKRFKKKERAFDWLVENNLHIDLPPFMLEWFIKYEKIFFEKRLTSIR